MKKNLYKYAAKWGFKPSIRIESSLDFDELSTVYNSCDLTVFPSYYEGQVSYHLSPCPLGSL